MSPKPRFDSSVGFFFICSGLADRILISMAPLLLVAKQDTIFLSITGKQQRQDPKRNRPARLLQGGTGENAFSRQISRPIMAGKFGLHHSPSPGCPVRRRGE